MSLRLLLDEDSQAKILVAGLRAAGHDVLTASEDGLESASDADVVEFAKSAERIVLTRNCTDFVEIHSMKPDHAGIICIFMSANSNKDMSYYDIVNAVGNIDTFAGKVNWVLAGEFISLNSWRS
jgi:predicted nuclease of predicted toxin-antitoxin system